jgi:hypothetical protein
MEWVQFMQRILQGTVQVGQGKVGCGDGLVWVVGIGWGVDG